MRKVPVLVVVFAVFALVSAPVHAGTALANDPPSVSLNPGANAANAFMLSDMFADPTGAQVDAGGSVDADGNVTIDGLTAPGTSQVDISAGSESGSSGVWVSQFKFSNRPALDNNNRLVGVAGGNVFANFAAEGAVVAGALPIGFPPDGGGTPGGGTPGGGAVMVSVGEVSTSLEGAWIGRSSGPAATGAGGTVNADGTYSLQVGSSASIVTFSVDAVDAVQFLTAPATEAGAPIVGSHTVAGGGGVAFPIGAAVPVPGGVAQVEITYNASSADGVAIAVIGFDGAVVGNNMNYSNPSGGQLQAGVDKNLSTSVVSVSGSVTPVVQIFNGGSAAVTVNISRCVVAQAANLVDYAIDPNRLLASHDLDSVDGLIGDILAQGAAGPTDEGDMIGLAAPGASDIANASLIDGTATGTVVADVFVQRVSGDTGTFVLNVTDGAGVSYAQFVPAASIPTDGQLMVRATGTVSAGAGGLIITMQASGGLSVLCDDLSLRSIHQPDNQFDANLIGG